MAELLRCNIKVIRPTDQASDGGLNRSGHTSSASVTPPRPELGVIVANGNFIGAEWSCLSQSGSEFLSQPESVMPITVWTGHAYHGLDRFAYRSLDECLG